MIGLWTLTALLIIGVGALPFTQTDYFCKDPDTDKFYSVNETWTSTTFCGNYTCKLRKRINTTDELVLDLNHDNNTHLNHSSNEEFHSSIKKRIKKENSTAKPFVTIAAKTTSDIQSIAHKSNNDIFDKTEDAQSGPTLKLRTNEGDILSINNEDHKESWEMKMLEHDKENDVDYRRQEKNKRNSPPEQSESILELKHSNNDEDGFLQEDQIKSLTKLLHKIKKSDIDAVVQIYNIAQDIYRKMDKVTDENLVEETITDLKHNNIKKLPDQESLRHVSDLINEGSYAVPQFTSVGPRYTYNNPQSKVAHAPAYTQNYQVWNPYQSTSLYTNMERPTATTTSVPLPIPGNYMSPIYTSQTVSDYIKPIAVAVQDYMYYEPSTQRPIGSGFQNKPIVVDNTPVYYPYKYVYNMTYPMSYPVSYISVYDKKSELYPVNSYYYPPVQNVHTKENTKDCVKRGKINKCIKKKSKKGKKTTNSAEKTDEKKYETKNETNEKIEKMPDWQTKPLNKSVLDEIKANILEKTTLLPLSLRKKVKLEKVGKVLKLDDWIRKKREIFNDEDETLTRRDLVGVKGDLIEQKSENKEVFGNKKNEATDYSMQNSEDYPESDKNKKVSKIMKDKFEKKLDAVMDYENDYTNQDYEAYIIKTYCADPNKPVIETDAMEYNTMEKNAEEDYISFFNPN